MTDTIPTRRGALRLALASGSLGLVGWGSHARAADPVRVGVLKLASSGPVFLAQELGFFREAGLDTELRFFEAAQPVAVATVSGDVDIGVTGLTAGFYNLAGKGALRIVAAQAREEPGYKLVAVVASRKAAEAGLKSLADLPGRSAGVTQTGSTFHYSLGILAEKHGFEIASVRIVPLQSVPNVVSALKGSQVDAAILPATAVTPLLNSGDAQLLGWADETPWQVAAMFTSPKMISARRPTLAAFVKAYQRGTAAFHQAFLGRDAQGKPVLGARADEFLAVLAKYTGQTSDSLRASIPFVDPQARLLVGDIQRQVRWYQGQKLVDAKVDADQILDLSFVDGHLDAPR